MRSKADTYVSPNQQHGWPIRPHHTFCVTDKWIDKCRLEGNRKKHLCKKICKIPEIYQWIFIVNQWILFESCELYIIARYKVSNFIKIRQDLTNLFFFPVSLWNQYNFRSSCFFFTTFKVALAAYTLWQNSCKTPLPQKNIWRSPFLLQFKLEITQMKTKNKYILKWWNIRFTSGTWFN